MDNQYIKNPCCILQDNCQDKIFGFGYFSNSKEINTQSGIVEFNDTPVITDIFDIDNGYIKVKADGWYYIQYVLNIPSEASISSNFAIYNENSAIEGTIINVNKKSTENSLYYGAQTICKIDKDTVISLKSDKDLYLKTKKPYENCVSLFILKLL